jgi:hypothetical protein
MNATDIVRILEISEIYAPGSPAVILINLTKILSDQSVLYHIPKKVCDSLLGSYNEVNCINKDAAFRDVFSKKEIRRN